ncbi:MULTISPECIES: hypothetical protein [Olivibacter]|uniref:Uncharacterized protein n=1 Tax=Olivibacter jilunii TaxID=985016 RepID=A0ABW6B2L7_9SPHI
MKVSSLKQTDRKKAVKKRSLSSSGKEIKRDAHTGRFAGMHKNLEKIEPVFIHAINCGIAIIFS